MTFLIRTDSLLQGGLREGQVTELVGPSSSGKTQVCIYAYFCQECFFNKSYTDMRTSCGLFFSSVSL